jgi:hypothetical protein
MNKTILTIIGVCGLAVAVSVNPGCGAFEPKIADPRNPDKKINAQTYVRVMDDIEDSKRAEAEAKIAAEQAKIRETQALARVKLLELEARKDIADAEVKRDAAKIEAETQVAVADSIARTQAASQTLQASLATIARQTDAGLEELQRIEEQNRGLLKTVLDNPLVRSFAAQGGVDTSGLIPLLIGGGGVAAAAYQSRKRRQDADKAWDEGEANARRLKEAEDKGWDESKRESINDALIRLAAALPAINTTKNL